MLISTFLVFSVSRSSSQLSVNSLTTSTVTEPERSVGPSTVLSEADRLFGPLTDERGDFLAKIFSVRHPQTAWHSNLIAMQRYSER